MTNKRITVPDGSVGVVLPTQLACELFSLCRLLRKPKQSLKDREELVSVQKVASDVMLALIDAGYETPITSINNLVGRTFIGTVVKKKEQE